MFQIMNIPPKYSPNSMDKFLTNTKFSPGGGGKISNSFNKALNLFFNWRKAMRSPKIIELIGEKLAQAV